MAGLIELDKAELNQQGELIRTLPSDIYEYFPSYSINVGDCKMIDFLTHEEVDGYSIKVKTIIRIPKKNTEFQITATHTEIHLVQDYRITKSEVDNEVSWGNPDYIQNTSHDLIKKTLFQAYQIILNPSLIEDPMYKHSDSGFISELNRITVMLTSFSKL